MEADQCIIPDCHKRRFIAGDVRHPYCSKAHADEGKQRKIFLPEDEECILPECHREKCKEGDIQHDYCSKGHAKEGRQRGILPSRKRPPSVNNPPVKRKPLQDENYLPDETSEPHISDLEDPVSMDILISPSDHKKSNIQSFSEKTPSDVGLDKVAMKIGSCDLLAVDLGIPLAHIDSIPDGPLKGLLTLAYWRDGKCGSSLPTTWGFLLKKMEVISGRNVAEELRETLSRDPACVLDSGSSHKSSMDNVIMTETKESFQAKFNAAIKEGGSVEVEIVKVVTLGPPEAGKTQLKRALTGNMKESTESTALSTGAEVIMERFFDGGTNSKWESFGKADLQAALYITVDKHEYNPTSLEPPSLPQEYRKQVEYSKPVEYKGEEASKDDHAIAGTSQKNKSPQQDVGGKPTEILEELSKKFKKLRATVLGNFSKSQGGRLLNKVRIIHFIDSGGQPAFFDLHPVVATSRAVYLIVYNSAEGLFACPKITYRRPSDFPTRALSNTNQTNLNMINRCLSTLHHCKKKFQVIEGELRDRLGSQNITWESDSALPVYVVGSRGKSKRSEDADAILNVSCCNIPTWRSDVVRQSVHFVESTDIHCKGVECLRQNVPEAECGFKFSRFPLKWFHCQLIFWSAEDPAFSVLPYCDLQDLCLKGGLVVHEEEFRALVTTFHMLGIFSCPEIDNVNMSKDHLQHVPVFTKPEVLYEQVSTIMTVPFRHLKSDQKLKQSQYKAFATLQESGIIMQESLKLLKIPDPIGSFSRFHLYLLKYLVKWGLAAEIMETDPEPELPRSSQELLIVSPKLFIPSILLPCEEYEFAQELKGSDIPSFALTIHDAKSEDCSIPQGLFPHFVVNIMNQREDGYIIKTSKGQATPRCRDVLAITKKAQAGVNYPYTIYIIENIDHVAVHICPDRLDAHNKPQWEPFECNIILSDLKDAMEKAYSRLYQKKDERMSTILACECCCPLVKKKPHLAKVDCQQEPAVRCCLSQNRVKNFEKECDSTMTAIVQPKTSKDCPSKLKSESVINSTFEFLPFLDDMIAHLIPLGTTLGMENFAMAVKNSSEDPDTKCLAVLKRWLERIPGATWTMFCSKLGEVAAFNKLRARIISEKCCNNGH